MWRKVDVNGVERVQGVHVRARGSVIETVSVGFKVRLANRGRKTTNGG